MKFISDEIIHLYLIKKELLEPEISEEIEKRLTSNYRFQKRVSEIKAIYEEYNRINKDSITLTPFIKENNSYDYRLAAYNSENYNEFRYLTTFASVENLIMIRVHYNSSSKEYKLYLVSDDMNKVKNARLKIKGFDMEYITDDEGIVTIKDMIIDENTEIDVNYSH